MRYVYLFLFSVFTSLSYGQKSVDINQAIPLTATTDGASVTVRWNTKADATGYEVRYRTDFTEYMTKVDREFTTTDSIYTFENVDVTNTPLEISVKKLGGELQATGYLYVGHKYMPAVETKEVLLLVESELLATIQDDIDNYVSVLERELYNVSVRPVDATVSVVDVKEVITQKYETEGLDYLILIGHVPVPYSGDRAIDGHRNNHEGAWVCDAFYGDIDGNWTDTSVDNVTASRDATKNVPGDGKYDQSYLLSDIEIAVGRIDFSNMPQFAADEATLTQKYLKKNIAYRLGEFQAPRRGLVDNNFGLKEGFGQGAIKSFSSFFPEDSVHYRDFKTLKTESYLWSFGAGGGSYKSASGITNTKTLAKDSMQSVFNFLFGSYFGDWDVKDNLLRAALGSGTILTTAWSGRPIWQVHPMAMGMTIGECLVLNQNDRNTYYSQFGRRGPHTSLLGDPTLQMYYYKPLDRVMIAAQDNILEYFFENKPVSTGVLLYGKKEGSFVQLTESPIYSAYGVLTINNADEYSQFVARPVRLESSPSGSYYNVGLGTFQEGSTSASDSDLTELSLYPNPSSDYININGMSGRGYSIYTVDGKCVQQGVVDNNARVEVKNLEAGLHFIAVSAELLSFVKVD